MLIVALTAVAVLALLRAALSVWDLVAAVPRSNADLDCF